MPDIEYEYMLVEMDSRPLVNEFTPKQVRDKILGVGVGRAEELKKQRWVQTSQIFMESEDNIRFTYMQVWKRKDFNRAHQAWTY